MADQNGVQARVETAAIKLFVESGVAETSMRNIARAAGVSLGAIYVYHKSKEELAEAVFGRIFTEIAVELSKAAASGDTLRDKLHAMIDLAYRRAEEDPNSIGFLFLSRQQFAKTTGSSERNPFVVFRTVIEDAMKSGEIPSMDPIIATALVVGAINQVVDTKMIGHLHYSLTDQVDTVTGACMRLLQQ